MATNGVPLKAHWITPASFDADRIPEAADLKALRKGTLTSYDFTVPLKAIGFDEAILANGFRFNAIVYDYDGMGKDRDGRLEIMPGIAGAKQYDRCPCVWFAPGGSF